MTLYNNRSTCYNFLPDWLHWDADSTQKPDLQYSDSLYTLHIWDIRQDSSTSFVSGLLNQYNLSEIMLLILCRLISRCRTILQDYNMSCDEVSLARLCWSKKIVQPRLSVFFCLYGIAARKTHSKKEAVLWYVETRIEDIALVLLIHY